MEKKFFIRYEVEDADGKIVALKSGFPTAVARSLFRKMMAESAIEISKPFNVLEEWEK